MNALLKIQQQLKAPKGQYNKFGGFRYRSCEDILEAVKPKLAEYNALLLLTDELVLLGDWVFVKATAVLKADGEEYSTSAYARLDREKKGMDAAQLTGAASSYARKYALNGLFLIDDAHDSDAQEPPQPGALQSGGGSKTEVLPPPPPPPPPPVPGAKKQPLNQRSKHGNF